MQGRAMRVEGDDLAVVSRALNLSPTLVRNLVDEVNSFAHAKVSNMRFETNDEGFFVLRGDVHGTVPGLSLRALSGREVERVLIELATAAARLSGRHCPTLLILDSMPSIIFDGFFDFFSKHLLDPANQFQTILCIPKRQLDLSAIRWKGWEVVRTEGKPPNARISQEIRAAKA